MLVRWAIPISGIDPHRVKLDHLHAVAAGWVDDKHWASPKPWSIRPLRDIDGVTVFEIITLTREAGERISTAITTGQIIRIGTRYASVLTQPRVLQAVTWKDLRSPDTRKAWSVAFLTPTAFGNGHRFSPWPDPSSVARSLTHRWNALRPDGIEALDNDPVLWRQIWVSDIDGHSEVLHLQGGLTVSGYLGRVRYVCEHDAVSQTFATLLRFAEFVGVGRYSTRGLGVVRLEPTWKPGAISSQRGRP